MAEAFPGPGPEREAGRYDMIHSRLGYCVIIDNMTSPASRHDVTSLQETFNVVGYDVITRTNCDAQKLKQLNTWILSDESHQFSNSLVLCLMGHVTTTGEFLASGGSTPESSGSTNGSPGSADNPTESLRDSTGSSETSTGSPEATAGSDEEISGSSGAATGNGEQPTGSIEKSTRSTGKYNGKLGEFTENSGINLVELFSGLRALEELKGKPIIVLMQIYNQGLNKDDLRALLDISEQDNIYLSCTCLSKSSASSTNIQTFCRVLRDQFMTSSFHHVTDQVTREIQDKLYLDDATIGNLVPKLPIWDMRTLAIQKMGMTLVEDQKLEYAYPNDANALLRALLDAWRNKDLANNKQKLAELLREAAYDGGVLNRAEIDPILQGTVEWSLEINSFTKDLRFADYHNNSVATKLKEAEAAMAEQIRAIRRLGEERSETQTRVRKLEAEKDETQIKICNMEAERDETQTKIRNMEAERDETQIKIQQLENRERDLAGKLDEKERKADETRKRLEERIAELEKQRIKIPKLELVSTNEMILEGGTPRTMTVLRSRGQVVISCATEYPTAENTKGFLLIYTRSGSDWIETGRIDSPCGHYVWLCSVSVNGREKHAVSCPSCTNIKLLGIPTGECTVVYKSFQTLWPMCEGKTGRMFVQSGAGGQVLELDCSKVPFTETGRMINTGLPFIYDMCYVPECDALVVSGRCDIKRGYEVRAVSCVDGSIQWRLHGKVEGKKIYPLGVMSLGNVVLVGDGKNGRFVMVNPTDGLCVKVIQIQDSCDIGRLCLLNEKNIVTFHDYVELDDTYSTFKLSLLSIN